MEERERLGLLPDLPPELEKELLPYYEQAAEEGLFTQDCGGEAAARRTSSSTRRPARSRATRRTLKVEDFWYLEPLQSALSTVEGSGS